MTQTGKHRRAAARSIRSGRRVGGLLIACGAALLAIPAFADVKTLPGSACQPSFFSAEQGLFRREPAVLINDDLLATITCPVVKDVDGGRIRQAKVKVLNRDARVGGQLDCELATHRSDGSTLQIQLRRTSVASPALQTLTFNGQLAAPGGSYSLTCFLSAPFGPARDLSGIVSYSVDER